MPQSLKLPKQQEQDSLETCNLVILKAPLWKLMNMAEFSLVGREVYESSDLYCPYCGHLLVRPARGGFYGESEVNETEVLDPCDHLLLVSYGGTLVDAGFIYVSPWCAEQFRKMGFEVENDNFPQEILIPDDLADEIDEVTDYVLETLEDVPYGIHFIDQYDVAEGGGWLNVAIRGIDSEDA